MSSIVEVFLPTRPQADEVQHGRGTKEEEGRSETWVLGFSRKSHMLTMRETNSHCWGERERGWGRWGEDLLLSSLMRFLFQVWKKTVKNFNFYYQELVGMGAKGVFMDLLQDSAISLLGGYLGQHTCGWGVNYRSVCVSKSLKQAQGSTLGDGMNGLCSETRSHVSLERREQGLQKPEAACPQWQSLGKASCRLTSKQASKQASKIDTLRMKLKKHAENCM